MKKIFLELRTEIKVVEILTSMLEKTLIWFRRIILFLSSF